MGDTMSSVVISGDTSGTVTVTVPAVAGTNTVTIPAVTGTAVVSGQNSAITAGTAVASTSGTTVDFTGIPSWVKRITVMFSGVSTSGSSNKLLQLGSGSVTTTGYTSIGGTMYVGAAYVGMATSTAGFIMGDNSGTNNIYGTYVFTLVTGNTWVGSSSANTSGTNYALVSSGNITLSGALDRVRITTVNGTDTFDAGSINILYE
jgi:hypothetical protein